MITEQDALLAAIRANPTDRTARLVYADWLDERDDPLGGYVRAETALTALVPGRDWEAAMRQLHTHCEVANRNFGGWEYALDLMRLREKIDRLHTLDAQMEIFGARYGSFGHEYRLNPPLRESELVAFELKHGLTLPAEYRAFLLRVGNGCVGPSYGLYPLSLTHDYAGVRTPFPVTLELADAIAGAAKAARDAGNWDDIPQPDDAWGRGYLQLSDHGCGNWSVLVVNGPLRGQMWHEGEMGLTPARTKSGEPIGFIAWYEAWLDSWLAPGAIDRWASHFRREPR